MFLVHPVGKMVVPVSGVSYQGPEEYSVPRIINLDNSGTGIRSEDLNDCFQMSQAIDSESTILRVQLEVTTNISIVQVLTPMQINQRLFDFRRLPEFGLARNNSFLSFKVYGLKVTDELETRCIK